MPSSVNTLYPIFLKTENLRIALIGGGKVADEKLAFLLKSSPFAQVTIISPDLIRAITETIEAYPEAAIQWINSRYAPRYLDNHSLVIAATGDPIVNRVIWSDAKKKGLIINVADTPDLCDFYLGSIVTKGDLKIAISTNGTSPTMAKRIRQWLEDLLPEDIPQLLTKMKHLRKKLKGDFDYKVQTLNELTESFIQKSN